MLFVHTPACMPCTYLLSDHLGCVLPANGGVQIYNKLNGRFNQQAINQALQSLTAEAHLYTTTDDDHYKAA